MFKITVSNKGEILKAESINTREIYLDWDLSEGVVFDGFGYRKQNINDLSDSRTKDQIMKGKENLFRGMFDEYKYFVNITDGKGVIHKEYVEGMDYDELRGDRFFNTIEEAEKYLKSLK